METLATRRKFLRNSAIALGLPTIPLRVLGQTTLQRRLEWQSFKVTPQYDSLLKAISLMKGNTNSADPNSWSYWTNIHLNKCPHGIAYFLAWHRGYLYYFERQLRYVSGDSKLTLPYWDYYSYSTIPAEFTNAVSTNPLYVDRLNTNVRQALTLAPFSAAIINFPRGSTDAFESTLENAPHNPVHDIIGNVMSTMQSPVDPIFWLHHANIDRLWVAWATAGGGRKMPPQNSSYWSGSHIYTYTLTMQRKATYDTRTNLWYYYQSESMPQSIPLAQNSKNRFLLVQATPENILPSMPPLGSFSMSGPRVTSEKTLSLGGALNIGLDERSVSVQMPISSQYWSSVKEISLGNASSPPGSTKVYRSVHLVLDDIELTEEGKKGGYYYQVYLNIPAAENVSNSPTSIPIGTVGPFQISGASHHGHGAVQLRFPLGRKLLGASKLQVGMASVSFVRVNGDKSPRGAVMGIAEARLELSTDDVQS